MAGVVQDVEFAESGGPTTLIARPPGLRTVSDFSRLAPISGATSDIDEAEAVIGYWLRVPHLGAVLWVHETGAQQDQLTRFTRAVTGREAGFWEDSLGHPARPRLCLGLDPRV